MNHHNTLYVARLLGTTSPNLVQAIARGKFAPPVRDEGGRYCWTDADIERARAAMAIDLRRKRREVANAE